MTLEQAVFYLFAGLAIFAGFRVITVRNPVHAALHLVLAFFAMSVLWLAADAEFLAIALILVYVGAVMVLFLFVVMMLDINLAPLKEGFTKYLPLGLMISGVVLFQLYTIIHGGFGDVETVAHAPADYSNTRALGLVLYTVYLYPFEIASVLLLVAIVAAIALTMRKRPGLKQQDIGAQVRTKKEDRLRIVKMESEGASDSRVSQNNKTGS